MYWQARAFAVEIIRASPQVETAATQVRPRSHVHAVDPQQRAACGQPAHDMYPLGESWETFPLDRKCPRCRMVLHPETRPDR